MKRAKRAKIIYTEVKSTISEYMCPHCHIYIIGAGIAKNVTRFTCEKCGNEIITN